jgi:hydrogenase 3 maturation protease
MKLEDITKKLSPYESSRIAFVGLGNELRGDDWAGIYFLRQLRSTGIFNTSLFIEAGISPENYVTTILDFAPSVIVFIDSSKCSNTAGDVIFLDSETIENNGFSTHSYSIKILEKFFTYTTDIRFIYIGIVPQCNEIKKGLSPPVSESINKIFGL